MVKATLVSVLLLAQSHDVVRELQLDLERTRPSTTQSMMIEVQAAHADGSPAKGTIACSGLWRKYDEQETVGWDLPFDTDSRGVIFLNPWIGTYADGEDLICRAKDKHGHQGVVSIPMPTNYGYIVVN